MAMRETLGGSWWIENLLRPALIAGMVACLTAPLVVLFQWLLPGWDGTYFMLFAFLASLEGILSERILQKRRITGWAYLGSRASEALLFLLLLKLANYIPLGFEQLLADAQIWASDPYQFVSGIDLFTGSLFLALWMSSLHVARMARELDVEEGKEPPPQDKTSTEYYLWLTKPSAVRDRQEVLGTLAEFFLLGGIMMLLAATAIHFFVSSVRVLAVPTLLYFALGIALLSQARFGVNYAGWQVQGITVQPGITRRWLVWAVVFMVGVALVALILPTYYTLGPFKALMTLVSMLYVAFSFFIGLIVFLFTLPLLLLNPDMERPEPPEMGPLAFPAPEAATSAGTPPWLEALASIVFWVVLLAIVIYAVRRVLRDRFGAAGEGEQASGHWWGRFLAWVRVLWQRWWSWGQEVQARLVQPRARREREEGMVAGLRRFFFPGRLPPRELIRYFYLSAARRAGQAGQPRRTDQTPYEYQAALDQQFPELEPDLEGLTEAFVEARYSGRTMEKQEAEVVKPLWQRIKAALRLRRVQS
jgi:hypothetical protein